MAILELLDRLQLCNSLSQFCLRRGVIHLGIAVGQSLFRTLLGLDRLGFVQIVGTESQCQPEQ